MSQSSIFIEYKEFENRMKMIDLSIGDSAKKHSHYFKDFSQYKQVDVYAVLDAFGVINPCLQHIVKKGLCAGQRGHKKDFTRDIKDIRDTAERALSMYSDGVVNELTLDIARYYMSYAENISKNSNCERKKIGVVLVNPGLISQIYKAVISTGYNNSKSGKCECDCSHALTVDDTEHAETMAINGAKTMGHSLIGSWAFINKFPCYECAMNLYEAGVKLVVFKRNGSSDALRLLGLLGIRCVEVVDSDDQD